MRTNQVEETKHELMKKSTSAGSGRTTPVPPEMRQIKPAVILSSWGAEQKHVEESGKLLRYDDVHTNQVHDTIHELGKKSGDSGRTTPVPSRHIGEVFAENKIGADWKVKQKEDLPKSGSSPWRSGGGKNMEPSLKLVNVTVEKSATGGANIHISENAHAQMANFMQQENKKDVSKTSSMTSTSAAISQVEQKSLTSSSVSQKSMTSSSMEQKSSFVEQKSMTATSSSQTQKSMTSSTEQKSMTSSIEHKSMTSSSSVEEKTLTSSSSGDNRLVQVPPRSPGPVRSAKITSAKDKGKPESAAPQAGLKGTGSSKVSQEVKSERIPDLEPKTSKVNSSSSTSSGPIPMPVTQSWFEQQEQSRSATSTLSSTSSSSSKISAITQNQSSTPLPVLAGWFQEEEKLKKSSQEKPAQEKTKEAPMPSPKEAPRPSPKEAPRPPPKAPEPKKPVRLMEPEKPPRHPEPPKPVEISEPKPQPLPKAAEAPKPPIAAAPKESVSHLSKASEVTVKHEEIKRIEIVEITNEKATEFEQDMSDAMKGKVRGNIAIFQQPETFARSPSAGNLANETLESMKGKVGESRKAYIQRASSSDRDDLNKHQRAVELEAMLRARNESGSRPPGEDPERLFVQRQKEERARELEEVAQLRATATAHNLWEDTDAHGRAELSRLQRAKELHDLAHLRPKKNWNEVIATGHVHDRDDHDDDVDAEMEETERKRRAREIQELTGSRMKKNWNDQATGEEDRRPPMKTPDPDLDLDEARTSIRSAAMAWQERDRASSRAENHDQQQQQRGSSSTPTPSRRIGNLFSRNSDHWQMQDYDDEFPAPPTAEEVGVGANLPAPPPRDSSKDYMMEYRGGGGGGSNHHQRSKH